MTAFTTLVWLMWCIEGETVKYTVSSVTLIRIPRLFVSRKLRHFDASITWPMSFCSASRWRSVSSWCRSPLLRYEIVQSARCPPVMQKLKSEKKATTDFNRRFVTRLGGVDNPIHHRSLWDDYMILMSASFAAFLPWLYNVCGMTALILRPTQTFALKCVLRNERHYWASESNSNWADWRREAGWTHCLLRPFCNHAKNRRVIRWKHT